MADIEKEVTDFIRACDAIHSSLAHGDTLTPVDRDLIQFSGMELLSEVSPA
jgi:hypothetical protein